MIKKMAVNTIDKDSPAFLDLLEILEHWAFDYGICLYPDRLAMDAANYIHDELRNATDLLDATRK